MKKKLGILVHPGWVADKENPSYNHKVYEDYIKQYDKTLVFLPEMNTSLRKTFLRLYSDDIINHYLGNKVSNDFIILFRLCGIDKLLAFIKEIYDTAFSVKINKNKIKGTYKKGKIHIKQFIIKVLENKYDRLDELTKIGLLFNGDQTWHGPTKEVIDWFDKLYGNEDIKDIILYKLGGIENVNLHLEHIMEKYSKYDIEIFGEYYNQCVKSLGIKLIKLDIEHRPIKRQSVFNMSIKVDYLNEDELDQYYNIAGLRK